LGASPGLARCLQQLLLCQPFAALAQGQLGLGGEGQAEQGGSLTAHHFAALK